ncbi:hypothetical protein C2G38_2188057 [Gigaspora rosea]|uniref:Uncharacterized protein n=1 Tax=Gigaspora rosea TaxID=44941 RepID=A0A397V555_9GLOM|nr:hypothetical protein C2G38_2188057 [Gigaspora rosea]
MEYFTNSNPPKWCFINYYKFKISDKPNFTTLAPRGPEDYNQPVKESHKNSEENDMLLDPVLYMLFKNSTVSTTRTDSLSRHTKSDNKPPIDRSNSSSSASGNTKSEIRQCQVKNYSQLDIKKLTNGTGSQEFANLTEIQ